MARSVQVRVVRRPMRCGAELDLRVVAGLQSGRYVKCATEAAGCPGLLLTAGDGQKQINDRFGAAIRPSFTASGIAFQVYMAFSRTRLQPSSHGRKSLGGVYFLDTAPSAKYAILDAPGRGSAMR